jgi:anaerobic magnesium-protoporphyrin IX monomethyl ester cyclase
MKTKVLFIVPPDMPFGEFIKSGEAGYRTVMQTSPPIGILSIASYVRKNTDVEFRIVDLNILISRSPGISAQEWKEKIIRTLNERTKDWDPDIVGISALFNTSYLHLKQLSKIAKEIWPKSLVVSGGALVSNLYKRIFENIPHLDAVAIAEAEKPFLGLVKAKNRREYLENDKISGWMTPAKAKKGIAPTIDFVQNLDDIPLLAYDLIDLNDYQKVTNWHGKTDKNSKIASILITRGCPYRCTYCANPSMHGGKLRYTSPQRVFSDIRELKEKFGVNIILIEDDSMLTDRQFTFKILDGLIEMKVNFDLSNGLGVNHIDEKLADKLIKAGINKVTLAVESGCERVLKELMHKSWTDLSLARKTTDILKKRGIYITATFVIGLPGETQENIQDTVKFIKDTGFNWSKIFIATPVAGSDLYQICLKNNFLVTDELKEYHFNKSIIKTSFFKPEEIDKLKMIINLDVNFVSNYDIKNKNFETALVSFEDIVRRVPDHAFAYYCIYQCYKGMNKRELAQKALEKCRECIKNDRQWAAHFKYFNINVKA